MQKQKIIAGVVATTAASALLFTSGINPSFGAPANGFKPAPVRQSSVDCAPGQIVIELHTGADKTEVSAKLQELNGKIVDVTTAGGQTFALVQVDQPDKNWARAFTELSKDKSHFDIVQLNKHYYQDVVRARRGTPTAPVRTRPTRPTRPAPKPTPKPTPKPKPKPTPKPTPLPKPTPPPVSTWPSSGNPNDTNLNSQTQIFVHNAIPAQRAIFAKGLAMPVNGAVKIGIIDTGVQGSLSCFASGQVLTGTNVWTNGSGNVDTDTGEMGGHGTFCASLMAAKTNDSSGGAGMLPGATIVPVNCFNTSSSTDTFHIIKGIQYLQTVAGVKFVNLSVNGDPPNSLNADASYQAACQAFNTATGGCIFNAAGNSGLADNSAPVTGNVVVEAVTSTRALASFSVHGTAVQLAGLGVSDGSTIKSGQFVVGDGTSFATPSVCAIAAAIQYTKGLSLDQTLALMKAQSNAASNGVPVPDMNLCVTAP